MSVPYVTVIIPHFNARELLDASLLALRKTHFKDFTTTVVDNGSSDGSLEMLKEKYPEVHVITSSVNLGFAGGCNLGIRKAQSQYIVLLNNDTEVKADWLGPMVELADSDKSIGAVQPKLLNFHRRDYFDYSGGAGGEIDVFGYPFARGRIFDSIEKDVGQYDQIKQIFWASGAATLLRRSALQHVGLFEEIFFAHMEEIDLNWRMQWAGYKIMSAPGSVVYHHAGGTLGKASLTKMVLNHRNNLLMILRNHGWMTLIWVLPLRIILECLTFISFLVKLDWKRAWAVILGFTGMLMRLNAVRTGRRKLKSVRTVPESVMLHRMYRKSIALAYFSGCVRRAGQL